MWRQTGLQQSSLGELTVDISGFDWRVLQRAMQRIPPNLVPGSYDSMGIEITPAFGQQMTQSLRAELRRIAQEIAKQ